MLSVKGNLRERELFGKTLRVGTVRSRNGKVQK